MRSSNTPEKYCILLSALEGAVFTFELRARELQSLLQEFQGHPFVRERIERNVLGRDLKVDMKAFWLAMLGCRLTSRQASSQTSPVSKFMKQCPHPLALHSCKDRDDLALFISQTLQSYGGIRDYNKIGKEMAHNLIELDLYWEAISQDIESLLKSRSVMKERKLADWMSLIFKGFGPKQTRNLLQDLGCTHYEVPIDTRITKWMNSSGVSPQIEPTKLSNRNYYLSVQNCFQEIARTLDLLPCVLDSIVFISLDKG